jgi:ankyrin repeat protein
VLIIQLRFHSRSSAEAQDSLARLQNEMELETIDETSAQNLKIRQSQNALPQQFSGHASDQASPDPIPASASTTGSWKPSMSDKDDAASIKSTDTTFSVGSNRSVVPSFQDTLNNSRPYKRASQRGRDKDSVFSVDSSEKGHAWSMLSDISLGDLSISDLADLELPICLSDLWDPEPYRVAAAAAAAAPISTPHKSAARRKWSSRGRIHNAIASGNDYVVRTLLKLGSDIEELDGKGRTPLAHAFQRNQFSIVAQLLERGASTEALSGLEASSDLPHKLKGAIDSGNEEVVRLLLQMGVDLEDHIQASRHDMPPLLYAAWKGKVTVVKLLLEAGADIKARDNEGWTVLHCAADSEDAGLMQFLLDRGALELLEITATSNTPGDTPLHIAALHNRLPIAKLLVEKGARVNPVNKEGKTPYQKACERSPVVAKYLLSQLQPAEPAADTHPTR